MVHITRVYYSPSIPGVQNTHPPSGTTLAGIAEPAALSVDPFCTILVELVGRGPAHIHFLINRQTDSNPVCLNSD